MLSLSLVPHPGGPSPGELWGVMGATCLTAVVARTTPPVVDTQPCVRRCVVLGGTHGSFRPLPAAHRGGVVWDRSLAAISANTGRLQGRPSRTLLLLPLLFASLSLCAAVAYAEVRCVKCGGSAGTTQVFVMLRSLVQRGRHAPRSVDVVLHPCMPTACSGHSLSKCHLHASHSDQAPACLRAHTSATPASPWSALHRNSADTTVPTTA